MPFLKQALTLHLLTETPAALSFLIAPAAQLPGATPEAKLILRNLGGLLAATNLACVALLAHWAALPERLSALLCASLGTYHVWPAYRAWARLRMAAADDAGRGDEGKGKGRVEKEKKVLGGPVVHLVVHVLCLGALWGGAAAVLMRAQE